MGKYGRRLCLFDKNARFSFCCLVGLIYFSVVFFLFLCFLCFYSERQGISMLLAFGCVPFFLYVFILLFVLVFWAFTIYFLYVKHGKMWVEMEHRERLCRFFLSNGWVDTLERKSEGHVGNFGNYGRNDFLNLRDFESKKEEAVKFPRVYYRFDGSFVFLRVNVPAMVFLERLLELEKDIEPLLFCELVEKTAERYYISYKFAFDLERDRINISDVKFVEGRGLRFMRSLYWDYEECPHALIVGGTGGGKTFFILTLLEAFLRSGAEISLLDPKNTGLSDFGKYMPNVYSDKAEMLGELLRFREDMLAAAGRIKNLSVYEEGKDRNFAYYGLAAHFLIFDEYVSFLSMCDRKEASRAMEAVGDILRLGRQLGYILILATQRPDNQYFDSGARDQFHFRVALGRNSEQGYLMAFGDVKKKFLESKVRGSGYVDMGNGVVHRFYTPLVPAGYDFLSNVRKMGLSPTVHNVSAVEGSEVDIGERLVY